MTTRSRRLALNAERLAALTPDEMSVVNGAALLVTVYDWCAEIRPPSDFFVSVCQCPTRLCG